MQGRVVAGKELGHMYMRVWLGYAHMASVCAFDSKKTRGVDAVSDDLRTERVGVVCFNPLLEFDRGGVCWGFVQAMI